MKYEADRNQRLIEERESKIREMEQKVEKVRARLAAELSILAEHEITLARKQSKGKEVGKTQERVEKKRALVEALELKLDQMEAVSEILRQEVQKLLDFSPLQDTLEGLRPDFRVAGKDEWKIPNSRFKTFQDVFTPSEARVIPDVDKHLTRKEYDGLPLEFCPVDPELVSDWFIEEFNLADLSGKTQVEKMETKVEITPDLRNLFSHLNPVAIHKEASYRLMTPEGHSAKHDGKLVKFNYTGRKKEEEDRKTIQVFNSVYAAHRSAHYVDEGYAQEQTKIHGIHGRVKLINRDLVGKKEDDPKLVELVTRLKEEIALLEGSQNLYKVDAHDILAEIADIRDSLGKHNPGASCARMVKALNQLEKRLPQMFQKNRWNLADRQILGGVIEDGKEIMDTAFTRYLELCHEVEKGSDRATIINRLVMLPDLSGLRVRPFSQYATILNQKKTAIKVMLQAGDIEGVRDEAIDAYVACKTFQAQHEREKILRDIAASPADISVDELLSRAIKLRDGVRSKETFPNVRTCCNDAYDEMARQLDKLVKGLRHYNAKGISVPEREAMYQRLKLFLEEINFTEVLEKLPHPSKM